MKKNMAPFHLAFAVTDLQNTRKFYQELLGCGVGRSSEHWIDFDFWGNQITAHLVEDESHSEPTNPVDGKEVPVRHFGAILQWEEWGLLAEKLKANGIEFVIEPYIRFKGQVGEQATMFLYDPSGNALEFKSFKDFAKIFAK